MKPNCDYATPKEVLAAQLVGEMFHVWDKAPDPSVFHKVGLVLAHYMSLEQWQEFIADFEKDDEPDVFRQMAESLAAHIPDEGLQMALQAFRDRGKPNA